jgi:hypothetical protein
MLSNALKRISNTDNGYELHFIDIAAKIYKKKQEIGAHHIKFDHLKTKEDAAQLFNLMNSNLDKISRLNNSENDQFYGTHSHNYKKFKRWFPNFEPLDGQGRWWVSQPFSKHAEIIIQALKMVCPNVLDEMMQLSPELFK